MKRTWIKVLVAVLTVCMLVPVFAGCKNNNGPATGTGETSTPASAAEAELQTYYNSLTGTYDYDADNKTALKTAYDTGLENLKKAAEDKLQSTLEEAKKALDAVTKVGRKTFTLRDYTSASPLTWSQHTWQTNGDEVIMSYAEIGFVDTAMKEEGVYEWRYEMATAIEDVTASATKEQIEKYGLTTDDSGKVTSTGRIWKISLNPDAVWADGKKTKINADTYIYSMQQLLSPQMKNSRANSYTTATIALFGGVSYYNGATQPKYSTLAGAGYASAADVPAGTKMYVDMYGFYGLDAAGCVDKDGNACPQWVAIDDETLYRDASVAEGEDGDWVSAKELYEGYFAPGAAYEGYATTYTGVLTGTTSGDGTWETVGLYKDGDYTLYYITENNVSEFDFLIGMGSTWLVYEPLYEAGKKTDDKTGLVSTNYGTSVETYMSYGPYKLTNFQKDVEFSLEKNEDWYGYTDGKHVGEFQTDKIVVSVLTKQETILMMFNRGQLDGASLTSDDLATYGYSEYLMKTPETYTMRFSFNTNPDVLKNLDAQRNDGTTVQILSNHKFITAMSLSFDRQKWVAEVTAGELVQVGLLSSLYFYDVEHDPNSVYRNSDAAMKAIVDYYGIKYGEGERYATLEDAYDACTGFDLDKAKQLFGEVYDEAVANGTYDGTSPIVINVGAAKGDGTTELAKQEKLFNTFLANATQGTKLEGKVSVKYIYNLADRYTDCATGNRECCYGGLGGAAFYPFGLFRCYTEDAEAPGGHVTEGNFDGTKLNVTIKYDFKGDGNPFERTESLYFWAKSVDSGEVYDAVGTTAADGTKITYDLKLTITAACEKALLESGDMFPITVTASVSMRSMKIKYATENYNLMYSYGGTRLMTYNYSDYEWEQFVASQGGELNYK